MLASNKQGKKLPFGTSTTRFKAKHAAGDLEEYAGPPPPGAYDPESMNKITGALQSLHTHVPSAAFNSRTGEMKTTRHLPCADFSEYDELVCMNLYA